MFRSHGGTVRGCFQPEFRVRLVRPVCSPPSNGNGRRTAGGCAAIFQRSYPHDNHGDGPGLWPGVGPALRVSPLASQVALALAGGDARGRPPRVEEVDGLGQVRALPAVAFPLRARFGEKPDLRGGWRRRETRLRSGLRSSNHNPLGNCVGARVETPRGLNSARSRFLIAPGRSAPDSCQPGPDTTPARGAGDICLPLRFAGSGGAGGTSFRQPFPGCPGLSQSRGRRTSRPAALRLFYQGTGLNCPLLRGREGFVLPNFLTARTGE
jgi:hypothetical protein